MPASTNTLIKMIRQILYPFGCLEAFRVVRKRLLTKSLLESCWQRGEYNLKNKMTLVVSDLTHQYTTRQKDMSDRFSVEKTRCQHAFQIHLALKAIKIMEKSRKESIIIVDIGDSAGTHVSYLSHPSIYDARRLRTLSVNLDPTALQRIRSRGFQAILCRAEDLEKHSITSDVFVCFQMLEHLFDPIGFLHSISTRGSCKYFVITVPYVRKSRVGLQYIKKSKEGDFYSENTHVFELCPEDWNLIFLFSGWRILFSDQYTQYPKRGLFNLMKFEWRRFDFDGFYGVILEKDDSFSKRYLDWPVSDS